MNEIGILLMVAIVVLSAFAVSLSAFLAVAYFGGRKKEVERGR